MRTSPAEVSGSTGFGGGFFQKNFWGQGDATEAAIACKNDAFTSLQATEVCSIIRDTNIVSQTVAKRTDMTVVGQFVKHDRGVDMHPFLFSVKRPFGTFLS